MKNQNRACLFALLAVLFWSTVGSAIKLSLKYIDYSLMLFYVCFVALLVVLAILLLQGKWKVFLKQGRKDIAFSAFLGFLNPFVYYLILFKAYDLLKAQEAVVLNYTWPVVLVFLSIPFLKQKISWLSIGAILISFIGTLVIATEGNIGSLEFRQPLGVVLAMSSAVIWGLFWIFNVRDTREDVVKMLTNLMFGFMYILIYTLVSGNLQVPEWNALLGAGYLGLFEIGLTFVIWLKALNLSTTTAKVSNLIYLSPFISLFVIRLTLGEEILRTTLIGLALIIAGILLQRWTGRKSLKAL